MAQLQVGSLIFHYATIRTQSYEAEPVFDPSGRHLECVKYTLSIVGLVNAITIATNKPNPAVVDVENAGDGLPYTMNEIQTYLNKPRQLVKYSVAGVTILESPRPLGDGTRLTCDVKGGPMPHSVRFTSLTGDKTAVLVYNVVVHDTPCNNCMLSNAWSISCDTNKYGLTTRYITGRAAFRKDLLVALNLKPDDFREWLLVPCGDGMRRTAIHVEENTAGDEISYNVVDSEVIVGLGANSPALEVTGTVSSTIDYPMKSLKEALGKTFAVGQNLLANIGNPLRLLSNAINTVWNEGVPTNLNFGIARATGRKGANHADLTRIAAGFILDRLSPVLFGVVGGRRTGAIMGTSVTVNLDTDGPPWSEVRLNVLGASSNVINAMWGDDVIQRPLIKHGDEYNINGDIVSSTSIAPVFGSNNSRGTWLGRMVTQALAVPDGCPVPADVPPNENAQDTNGIF